MNDREIVAAAMRWATAHAARREASAASNKFKADSKRLTGFGGADFDLSRRVTNAKRTELAALRAMAKLCASARTQQIDDADMVINHEVLRLR